MGGLEIPLVKIGNTNKSYKPIIFIIARQHSGETHSSFVIHGFINFLLSQEQLANKLREILNFWIIPMANPDGVVLGNYRCTLMGKDMNRSFYSDDPSHNAKRLPEVDFI